ncbi:MAG: MmgE/PrpD family protein [bacterium]
MTPSKTLATFCANLKFDDIPPEVAQRTLELMLDWAGSCLAGSSSRQALILRDFAIDMGPEAGASRILGSDQTTSPLFAALVNAAASHVVEQDDLHNSSVFHPATVVFPPAIAVAERENKSGRDLITACVAGYEAGIRIGEFLGRSHYRIFHTTATAGTLAAAMATASLLDLDQEKTLDALGSAGTQAAGLWEFLRDAADSKQLHTAKASADGLLAAYTARSGLTGAARILEGDQGLGAGLMAEGSMSTLTAGLGERWALLETSFKFHASCRHTHPAADAMLKIMQNHGPDLDAVTSIRVHVYQAAYEVLGAVDRPSTVHQSKFSMGFVLALIAQKGRAGVSEFTDSALKDPLLLALHDKVSMQVDSDIDAAYPNKWCAKVEVTTTNGEKWSQFVDTPVGDPGNALSRKQIEQKVRHLTGHFSVCTESEINALIGRIWQLPLADSLADLFYVAPLRS